MIRLNKSWFAINGGWAVVVLWAVFDHSWAPTTIIEVISIGLLCGALLAAYFAYAHGLFRIDVSRTMLAVDVGYDAVITALLLLTASPWTAWVYCIAMAISVLCTKAE